MVPDAIQKIALTQIEGVGPVTTRQLVAYLGGIDQVFKSKKKDLLAIPGIGEKTAVSIFNHKEAFNRAEEEMKFIERRHQMLFYTDKMPFRFKS
jgi:DNA processing protein